jgi:hypothetical protein
MIGKERFRNLRRKRKSGQWLLRNEREIGNVKKKQNTKEN